MKAEKLTSDSTCNGKGKGPLAGVKVLDLTSVLMGPYCTQILADMGADVIKVESPDGDTTRYLQAGRKPGMSYMFVNLGRGKRSIVLDLKQGPALEVLKKLILDSDVFIHSMRHDAIKRLGLDYESVRAIKSDIVYANLYGYSRSGPYANWAAYDDTIQGICGLAMLQEATLGQPRYVPTVMADKVTGLTAAYAVAMALFHHARTGEGQEIEVSMFETMVSFLMVEHVCGTIFEPAEGPPGYQRALAPNRKPYKTADGYVSVLIYNQRQWLRFVELAGQPEALLRPDFATFELRAARIDEVYAAVGQVLATRTTAHWIKALQEAGIPAVPLKSLQELSRDPHLEQIGFFVSRQTKQGAVRFPGIPTRFSQTPGHIREAAPGLGEHTRQILADAGLGESQIEQLLRAGIAIQAPHD